MTLAIGTTAAGCTQPSSSDTTTSKPTTASTTTDPRARVALKKESHLAKAWTLPQDTFRFPKGDAVPLSDLNESVRDAVRTAIEAPPYSIQDASQPLLDGIDALDLVTYEGTVWDIEHTFPTVTVRLDTNISESEVTEDRTVTSKSSVVQSNEAIKDLVWTIAPQGVETEPQPYETTRITPAVRDFLDQYDYIETPQGVGELVVSRTNRSPPHTIRAREATDEQLYGHPVREATEYGPPTQAFIDRVLASDRKTPGNYQNRIHTTYPDDVPWQFARDLDHGSHYVRREGEVDGFDTRHVHWSELPLEVAATIAETNAGNGSPVDIQLTVQNTGDTTVILHMAGLAPFGVLWAYGPGGERVLWNDAYEQTENVVIENGNVLPESHAELDLPPGQTRAATYRLDHDHLGATEPLKSGSYEVLGTVWAKWPPYAGAEEYDWRSQLFPYTVTIEVI